MEAFLGGRSLPASALTVSILASAVNAMSVITFLGHFYGHGFHIIWLLFSMPLSMVVTSVALVPLLYNLRTVSIFQAVLKRREKTCVSQAQYLGSFGAASQLFEKHLGSTNRRMKTTASRLPACSVTTSILAPSWLRFMKHGNSEKDPTCSVANSAATHRKLCDHL
ncbi:hypothetical protein V5799_031040 [Amblyomma americanum]|uniref:Uncharacterized protein n=1 Tax=Amblyomma americanum TaxID=6943 RepID=A0AAQ4ELF4_AMBAM